MNKRQAKKAFKKKYGYNPPHPGDLQAQAFHIGYIAGRAIRRMIDGIQKASQRVKETIKEIQAMPDDEFEAKMARLEESGADPQALAMARAIRIAGKKDGVSSI